MHLTEAVGHFHLYAWLQNAVGRRCAISPEFADLQSVAYMFAENVDDLYSGIIRSRHRSFPFRLERRLRPEKVDGNPDRSQMFSRNVEIGHGGLNRLVPHEHLDFADVVARLEKMGAKQWLKVWKQYGNFGGLVVFARKLSGQYKAFVTNHSVFVGHNMVKA